MDTAPLDGAIDRHLDLGIDPFVGTAEEGHRQRARDIQVRRRAQAAAAVRRRRILMGLAVGTFVAVLGVVVGVVPLVMAALPALALGGYTVLLRTQSKQRAVSAQIRAREARPEAERVGSDERTWEPRTAPEPSYMRAPKATALNREIDSTKNGPWTTERMLEEALHAGQDEDERLGLDEYAYPREYQTARAVNE